MTRKREDIRLALDTTLSGASHDPTLYHRVVNASKGDSPPVKRKLTFSMALVLILCLLTGGVAVAATYRGVSWFFDKFETETIDPAYLMDSLEQNHTSLRLDARVVDAYWDGTKLSVACNFSLKDPSLTFSAYCYLDALEGSDHDCSNENADILLLLPDFINITAGEKITQPFGCSYDWLHEDDGSLTMMLTFVVNDMSESINITIPIYNLLNSTGAEEEAYLHFQLPALADPIAPHEHDWAEATCVSPKTCTICGRTTGGLGKHAFGEATCIKPSTCTVCGVEWGTLSLHHQYGDDGYCTLCNKYYQYADKSK